MTQIHIDASLDKKLYFASDFHLGTPSLEKSRERELKILRWLEEIKKDAAAIFLLGDIFDFWYEYKKVIPKGFARFQGKIAELTDSGIPVIVFSGNHDMWMNNYLSEELGAIVYHEPASLFYGKHKLLIGHGDGLGPGDNKYKLLKKLFKNRVARWMFSRLHPNFSLALGQAWSKNSRINSTDFEGESHKENEFIFQYCESVEAKEHYDYYIFGHRHLQLDLKVGNTSRYVNLGEWVNQSGYASFHNGELKFLNFEA
ncbi:MAG: UDP-2,3-diacylglucosamine diphosphatase [Cyclobacteriaceae bacterium]|nr:UDP-2,3-diacylglucosamine diphosphatase [Cyclobacteriaceae bacterium]